MLDFRPRAKTRNYLSRREQRRVFAWVIGIGLVVIVCVRIGEISRWLRTQSATAAHSIDTRFVPKASDSGEPDAVSIVKAEQFAAASQSDGLLAGVNADLLRRVRDDTPWIRSDEIDAWLNVWDVLRKSNDEELAGAAAANVGFVELFQQPRAFRGKLVKIRGSARQATYVKAAENAQGVDGYYRVIIRPDQGPPEPLFLYTAELPRGFPTGETIRADVEAIGIFFKRMVYPTKDNADLRRAPVVMARTLAWRQPTVPADVPGGSFVSVMVALVVVGVAGLVGAAYWAAQVRVSAAQGRPATLPPINDRDVANVKESLAKLAERDR